MAAPETEPGAARIGHGYNGGFDYDSTGSRGAPAADSQGNATKASRPHWISGLGVRFPPFEVETMERSVHDRRQQHAHGGQEGDAAEQRIKAGE